MFRCLLAVVLVLTAVPSYGQVRFGAGYRFESVSRKTADKGDIAQPASLVATAEAEIGRLVLGGEAEMKANYGRPKVIVGSGLAGGGVAFPFQPSIREFALTAGYEIVPYVSVFGGFDRFAALGRIQTNNLSGMRETVYEAVPLGVAGGGMFGRWLLEGELAWYPRVWRLDYYPGGDGFRRHGNGRNWEATVGYRFFGPLGVAVTAGERRIDTEDPYWSSTLNREVWERSRWRNLGLDIIAAF